MFSDNYSDRRESIIDVGHPSAEVAQVVSQQNTILSITRQFIAELVLEVQRYKKSRHVKGGGTNG
jgi:hypothetical protein